MTDVHECCHRQTFRMLINIMFKWNVGEITDEANLFVDSTSGEAKYLYKIMFVANLWLRTSLEDLLLVRSTFVLLSIKFHL